MVIIFRKVVTLFGQIQCHLPSSTGMGSLRSWRCGASQETQEMFSHPHHNSATRLLTSQCLQVSCHLSCVIGHLEVIPHLSPTLVSCQNTGPGWCQCRCWESRNKGKSHCLRKELHLLHILYWDVALLYTLALGQLGSNSWAFLKNNKN